MNLMPKTVSAKSIQRNYRRIFDEVKQNNQPTVVLTNNTPDVAIVSIPHYESLQQKIKDLETQDSLRAIKEYHHDKKNNQLIEADSLETLTD